MKLKYLILAALPLSVVPVALTSCSTSTSAETKPEVKPETKPEVKPEVKPETKPEVKPEVKPETKPEVKPEKKIYYYLIETKEEKGNKFYGVSSYLNKDEFIWKIKDVYIEFNLNPLIQGRMIIDSKILVKDDTLITESFKNNPEETLKDNQLKVWPPLLKDIISIEEIKN